MFFFSQWLHIYATQLHVLLAQMQRFMLLATFL
jgi:hypothetical protein